MTNLDKIEKEFNEFWSANMPSPLNRQKIMALELIHKEFEKAMAENDEKWTTILEKLGLTIE